MKDKKTVAQVLGDNLKRIRQEKGVSRKQLAAAIETTDINFGKYERGDALPPLDKIFAIADFLKVSVASITGENDFSANVPNVQKIVDEKIFEYRLQRAYQMAEYFLDSLLNREPNFDKEGRIVIFTPAKVEYKNGVISFSADNEGNLGNYVAFKDKADFVKVMEQAEKDALHRQINFNAAFRQIS